MRIPWSRRGTRDASTHFTRRATAPWSTGGNRVGKTVPWGHRREKDTIKRGVDLLHFGEGVLRPVLHFEGCGGARFPYPHYLDGGARKATLCFRCLGLLPLSSPGDIRRGRSLWIAASSCLADSWNLSTTDITASSRKSEEKIGASIRNKLFFCWCYSD